MLSKKNLLNVQGIKTKDGRNARKARGLPKFDPEGSGYDMKGCEGGKEKLIRFGDANMKIKKNIPARKKSYCSRSAGIKGARSKLSANYWSRRAWDC